MNDPTLRQVCGIVMPISAIDGCAESHWSEVLGILTEAIDGAGFEANLVSNADEVGFIHKRIIQNLHDNPIVVCDVSGKNPNVMFELGLRLAFDKPTVIVKDDKTSYSFDTSAIEHLEYPRDLRFSRVVEFKQKLAEKLAATHKRATSDPAYTTFLKHFGEFKVAKLDKKEVSGQEFILEEIRGVRAGMRRLELSHAWRSADTRSGRAHDLTFCMADLPEPKSADLLNSACQHPDISDVDVEEISPGHRHLVAIVRPGTDVSKIQTAFSELLNHDRSLKARSSRHYPKS